MNRPHIRRIRRAPTGHRIGESHHRSKLLPDDVRNARALMIDYGLSPAEVAPKFDISERYARQIRDGQARVYD